jgi:hypothetical protein
MYIHHDLNTGLQTPYKSMRDVSNHTGITIGRLKYHFSIRKKTEWATNEFKITRTELVTQKKKPRGVSAKWGFE